MVPNGSTMHSEPIPADESPKKDPQTRVPRSILPTPLPPTNTGRYVTGAGGHSDAILDGGLSKEENATPQSTNDATPDCDLRIDGATPSEGESDLGNRPENPLLESTDAIDPAVDPVISNDVGEIPGELSFDDIAVDEMVRDLELESEAEQVGISPDYPTSASEDDFAVVGVRNFEWRLSVIRVAAHRSADAIAASQLVEPSEDKEEKLARIVLSTYRLIDPRFRVSYFQQVRVGRLLPLALQRVACVDFTPPTLQTRSRFSRNDSVRLFGHPFPVKVHGKHDSVVRKKIRRRARKGDVVSGRAEALEVLAELRLQSSGSTLRRWVHDTRFLTAMIVVIASTTVGLGLFAARRSLIRPRPLADHSTDSIGAGNAVASIGGGPAPEILASSDVETELVAVDPVESAVVEALDHAMPHAETLSPEISNPVMTTDELLAALADVAKGTPIVPPTSIAIEHELPEVAPVTSMADASSDMPSGGAGDRVPGNGFPGSISPGDLGPGLIVPRDLIPEISGVDLDADREATGPDIINGESMVASSNGEDVAEPTGLADPTALSDPATNDETFGEANVKRSDSRNGMSLDKLAPKSPAHSDDEIATAVSELWAETDSAARRFTGSTVAGLIEQWDLVAEIAGPDSLEYAAAQHLIRQAAWLSHPMSDIVASLRQTSTKQPVRFIDVTLSDSETKDTASLTVDEIGRLMDSWRAARRRVVATVDVERMLLQANVLLDRIVVSDRLDATKRSDTLTSFRTDVERLAKIVSDKDLLTETNELTKAIDSLPASAEWARLQAADKPSGLLGTIYCLHQRRWEEGIVWLGQSSNLVVAGCAKAECELLQSGGPSSGDSDWIALADRWTKVAQRLNGREAAAIRLHALEIYGDDESMRDNRQELLESLPKYLRPEQAAR
ncbi:hypothetical protein RRSWK_06457 [Rhodopirellula sp. SWK7]|nr:hypothetical protein RRSWK_06457 [Rhodopirellula sp. SWK7]